MRMKHASFSQDSDELGTSLHRFSGAPPIDAMEVASPVDVLLDYDLSFSPVRQGAGIAERPQGPAVFGGEKLSALQQPRPRPRSAPPALQAPVGWAAGAQVTQDAYRPHSSSNAALVKAVQPGFVAAAPPVQRDAAQRSEALRAAHITAKKSLFLKWKLPFCLYFLHRFADLIKLSGLPQNGKSARGVNPMTVQLIDCLLGSEQGHTTVYTAADAMKNAHIVRLRSWCEHIVAVAGGPDHNTAGRPSFSALRHWNTVDDRLHTLFQACTFALRANLFQKVCSRVSARVAAAAVATATHAARSHALSFVLRGPHVRRPSLPVSSSSCCALLSGRASRARCGAVPPPR